MRILDEQEKRDALHGILLELSKSQDILKESRERISFYKRLETVYYNCDEENFRHFYSDIFPALTLLLRILIFPGLLYHCFWGKCCHQCLL